MKVFGKITCILLFSVTSFCIFLIHPFSSHADHTPKQVLFISSYSESFITVPQQIQGMKEVFEGTDVVLQYEYLDAKRLSSEENVQYFYEYLSYKLSTLPPYEAILVADDAALQFVMDYQAELFDQIPIVFFAINDRERATNADALPNTAGSIEETSLEDNISLALSINPTATKVVGIADNTVSGLGDQKQFYKAAESFPELDFSILNASDLTYEEIWNRLENISPDTILLYLCLNEDSSKVFIDFNTATEKIAEHASVPVYRATVGGIGMGIFGGHLISYEEMGRYSAELVLSILDGNDIDAIPLKTDTPYYSAFDYSLIEKYNVDIDLLPEDAIFYNKPESPFDQYRKYFIYLAIVLVFSITISVIMVIDSIKSRMLRKKLQNQNDELGSLYEELTASEEELRHQYDMIENHANQMDLLHQKFEIAITATNCVVWEMDLDKDEVILSPNILELTGVPFPEKVSRKLFCQTLFPEQYQRSILNEVEYYISGKVSEINLQVPLLPFRNENKWLLVRGKGLKDSSGKVKTISGILMDITLMKEREEYITYLANHDYLTKLPNRMHFMGLLEKELKKESHGTILLFDIDNFKSINDTLGHVYGDKLLVLIAERLCAISDSKMHIARIGGDEFLILLKEISDLEEINRYILKIKTAFEEPFDFDNTENHVRFSMGITRYPKDSNNIDHLLMNADTAMYKVKQNGRNNYVFYQENMKHEAEEKRYVEKILRSAMDEGGFTLLYQPQVDAKTGEIASFEALLRLRDYHINPGIFIPIAEESGLILQIGRWVAREAFSQIAKWREAGFQEKMVSINYSSKQLRDSDFVEYLNELSAEYNVATNFIEIEITEGILLENNIPTIEFLEKLKKFGYHIALDDFGTGFSSLNYLTYIPVDKIKLDKSINDKFLEMDDSTVIDSLISLSHGLNLEITAEGIEDWRKYTKLRDGGCDYIQGYLFSKPVSAKIIESMYNSNMLKELTNKVIL